MPTPERLLEIAMAFWKPAVLVSANELGLFAELTAGPCDAASLVRRLGLRPDATADFLEALVALGLLERSGEQYRNSLEATSFLDPTKPAFIGHWLAMAGAALREMADLTTHLRAAGADRRPCPSLADRMWADIAGILGAARAHDNP
jgi:DNA-binding IclR family transcriptional regulator